MKVRYLLISVTVLFIVSLLTIPSYAKLDPKTIAGMWLFDEGNGNIAKDSSVNVNNGKLIGVPKWVNGKFGKALEFDGVDDYVNVDYNSSLKLGNTGAISVWFKPSALNVDTHNIVSYGGVHYDNEFLLNQEGAASFLGYWKTPGPSVSVSPAFSVGEWTHVVLTNDKGNLKVYLNGVQKGNGSSGGDITNDYPVYIGADPIAWRTSGIIDDVVIFNVSLEEADVQTLMNKGLKESLGVSAVDLSGKLASTWAGIKAR